MGEGLVDLPLLKNPAFPLAYGLMKPRIALFHVKACLCALLKDQSSDEVMAEPFGVVASAVSIGGAALKLAQVIAAWRFAPNGIKAIAAELDQFELVTLFTHVKLYSNFPRTRN